MDAGSDSDGTVQPGCESCAESSAISRRRLLAGGARLGLIAGALGAIGPLSATAAGASTTKRSPVVKSSKLAVGSAQAFEDPYTGTPAYLVHPRSGEYRAFSRICTHMGCTVNFSEGKFICPCHGSQYNAATGAVEHGPAPRALPEYPVVVSNGEIYIES